MSGGALRRRAVVDGVVQGVGFRFATVEQARQLGLSGWVRNLPDGRVETEFHGDVDAVEAMTAWLRSGPPTASVAGVVMDDSVSDDPASDDPASGFRIR